MQRPTIPVGVIHRHFDVRRVSPDLVDNPERDGRVDRVLRTMRQQILGHVDVVRVIPAHRPAEYIQLVHGP